jgi:hypothetical protein
MLEISPKTRRVEDTLSKEGDNVRAFRIFLLFQTDSFFPLPLSHVPKTT